MGLSHESSFSPERSAQGDEAVDEAGAADLDIGPVGMTTATGLCTGTAPQTDEDPGIVHALAQMVALWFAGAEQIESLNDTVTAVDIWTVVVNVAASVELGCECVAVN